MFKKLLSVGLLIIFVLAMIDYFILKDHKGLFNEETAIDRYERLKNIDTIPTGTKIDQKAPKFTLKTVDEKQISLESYKGKKVILNFWATWCPPCQEEIPYLVKLYESYEKEGVIILGVDATQTEESLDAVNEFVTQHKMTFPVLLDETGEVSSQYEILAYPTTYFIDSDGVIRNKITGALKEEQLFNEMKRLP